MGRTELPTDSLKGVHVLVVENDDDSRALLQTILQYCGALVTVVAVAGTSFAFCCAAAAFTVRRCIMPRPKAATPKTRKRLSWRRCKFFSRDIAILDATDAEF